MFETASGDMLGLPTNENHINLRWVGSNVFISYCRKGDAISMHFSSDKKGLRSLKLVIGEFCSMAFRCFGWCQCIIGIIDSKRKSIHRLAEKLDFVFLSNLGSATIYKRVR